MVAIAGPIALSQKGVATSQLLTDQMIASYLAQDGMEAVKNIRDTIALTARGQHGDKWELVRAT